MRGPVRAMRVESRAVPQAEILQGSGPLPLAPQRGGVPIRRRRLGGFPGLRRRAFAGRGEEPGRGSRRIRPRGAARPAPAGRHRIAASRATAAARGEDGGRADAWRAAASARPLHGCRGNRLRRDRRPAVRLLARAASARGPSDQPGLGLRRRGGRTDRSTGARAPPLSRRGPRRDNGLLPYERPLPLRRPDGG